MFCASLGFSFFLFFFLFFSFFRILGKFLAKNEDKNFCDVLIILTVDFVAKLN